MDQSKEHRTKLDCPTPAFHVSEILTSVTTENPYRYLVKESWEGPPQSLAIGLEVGKVTVKSAFLASLYLKLWDKRGSTPGTKDCARRKATIGLVNNREPRLEKPDAMDTL